MVTAFIADPGHRGYFGSSNDCANSTIKRTFTCPQCDTIFNRAAHLRRHQRRHQGDKPFTCSYCSLSSSRKDVIIRHTRNFHPEMILCPAASDTVAARELHSEDISKTHPTSQAPPQSEQVAMPQTTTENNHNEPQIPEPRDISALPGRTGELNLFLPLDLDFPDLSFDGGTATTTLPHSPSSSHPLNLFRPSNNGNLSFWPTLTPDLLLSPLPDLGSDAAKSEQVLIPASPEASLASHHSSSDSSERSMISSFDLGDDDYAWVQANIAQYDHTSQLSNFTFPSKHALIRFIKAYFRYMAPHFPIIHEASFNASTTPSPLLIAMMACGAIYVSQQDAAIKMQNAVLQLMAEHWKKTNKFDLWLLQTSVLVISFEMYSGGWSHSQRAFSLYSGAVQIAQEGLQKLDPAQPTIYADWVHQESFHRCIACLMIIGAGMNSMAKEQCLQIPGINPRFLLPSAASNWSRKEDNWQRPAKSLKISDALKAIYAGTSLQPTPSDFGLLAILSVVLGHICSFESLTSSQHPHLWSSFVKDMEKAVQILETVCKDRQSDKLNSDTTETPHHKSVNSCLSSIIFHLYGSTQLKAMKDLLSITTPLDDLAAISDVFKITASAMPDKALTHAAIIFRDDARTGLQYLQKIGPRQFAPGSFTAMLETSLILYWYLQSRHINGLAWTPNQAVDILIDEGIMEFKSQDHSTSMEQTPFLPLIAYSIAFHDDSVWQWLPAVSSQLDFLAQQLKLVFS